MTAAIWITAAWIVAATMTALGLCALIGANQSVERATRYADGQKQRADRLEEDAAYWHAAYCKATGVTPLRSGTPIHDDLMAEHFLDQLDTGVPEGWGRADVHKWVSMAEALGWGLIQRPSYTVTGGSGHAAASGIEWGGKSVRESLIDTAARTPDGWVLRNNSSANAAERRPDEPAPTLYFGQRSNYCAWEWRGEGPAPDFPEWAFKRPATTVVGSFRPDIIAAPGYRTAISRQNALDSIRVTVQEAGVLQSFPADHPWQGAKGKQFLQAGNAIPPGLALHALAAAAGVDARGLAA